MKIALVYFKEELQPNRKHHAVEDYMLEEWQKHYKLSGTKSIPCLLLDRKTMVPKFWEYDSIVVENDTPEKCKDVLNKVGWIKHQAYDLLGKCVVMDIDAFLKKSIDDLSFVEEDIAMAPDEGTYRSWPWANDWQTAKHKYNAGVIYINSFDVGKRFRELWKEKIKYLKITYYDEIIFSSILEEKKGKVLSTCYNLSWGSVLKENTRVIHFSGKRKEDLPNYLKKFNEEF